jgi:chromosome segregation ATPase
MPIDPQKADELSMKIAELREQLKGLGNVVSGLTNKVLKTEEGLSVLQAQLEEQAAQVQKMQEESAGLKKRLSAAESQMQTNMMIGALGVAIGALAALKAFGVF